MLFLTNLKTNLDTTDPLAEFKDFSDFLLRYERVVESLQERQLVNLTCTLGGIDPEVEQHFQTLLFFDIDDTGDYENPSDNYREIVAGILKIPADSIFNSHSGNGHHLVIQTDYHWEDLFGTNQIQYQLVCGLINDEIKNQHLQGFADSQVFKMHQKFRVPGGVNLKENKDPRKVRLVHKPNFVQTHRVNLVEVSGMPLVNDSDFLKDREFVKRKIDRPKIEEDCGFLQWCKKNQPQVSEAQWYAMLSIVSRFPDGEKAVHDYSKGHPSYDPASTNRKAKLAIEKAGPRTCKNISTLFEGCKKCPHWGKIRSPIVIKDDDFIATKEMGFHHQTPNGKWTPDYDGLMNYFNQHHPFATSRKKLYLYQDNHWVLDDEDSPDYFAEKHFYPKPRNQVCNEFRGKLFRNGKRTKQWWVDSVVNKVNFLNGVLDIETDEMFPHSKEFGFRYILQCNYSPSADASRFKQFLNEIMQGDTKLIELLLEFGGYVLANGDPFKGGKFLLLTGSGSNGKSTFVEILKALCGAGVRGLKAENLASNFHLQQLDGALVNICEETPGYLHWSTWETIKNLATGGELSVEKKFKDPYMLRNRAKIIMTCNRIPKGMPESYGSDRRPLMVPFEARFTEENRDVTLLDYIVKNELAGVFNLFLAGYRRLVKNKYVFTVPDKVIETLQRYREDTSFFENFIKNKIVISPDAPLLPTKAVYEKYISQCEEENEKVMPFNWFNRNFLDYCNDKFPGKVSTGRERLDGQRVRVFKGFRLADKDDLEMF